MKKIITLTAAALMCFVTATSVFGASSAVKISGGKTSSDISYSYDPDSPTTSVKSIKKLMTNLSDLANKNKIIETIKISSESITGTPVKFSLRLENTAASSTEQPAKATPSPEEGNVFDYYNIVVKTADGDVVYDYEKAEETRPDAKYKDIELLTLNTSKSVESAEYEITVSVNKDLADKAREASKLDWEIVTDAYSLKLMPTPEPVTPAPSKTAAEETAVISDELPIIKPDAAEEKKAFNLGDGTYIVGEDINSGRYEITGDAAVKVYTKEGDLKTNIHLTTEKDSETGVNSYVLSLNTDGETVEVTGEVTFTPYSPVKVTAAPVTGSNTSSIASTSKASATAKPSAASAPKNERTSNPKTGDNAPVAVTAAVGIMAFLAIAVIEYRKKKRN